MSKGHGADRGDLYDRVTRQIVDQLEQGVLPWRRPWSAEHRDGPISIPLRANGKPYRGLNVLLCWIGAMSKGYSCPRWMTYKQATELGGQVRGGEKGQLVVFAKDFVPQSERDKPADEQETRFVWRGYTVFNVEQIAGLPEKFYALRDAPQLDEAQRIEQLERFCRNTGCPITDGGNRAFCRNKEAVFMPPFTHFESPGAYYATLLHELTHWTGHPDRCNRDYDAEKGRKVKGSLEARAMEELVAEMGAAFLCASLGVSEEPRDEHAQYLANWLTALRDDKKLIFTAASHAQKAADCLWSFQPQEEEIETAELAEAA